MKHRSKIRPIAGIPAPSMPAPALDSDENARQEKPLERLAWQKPLARDGQGPVRSLLGLLGHSAECAGLAMEGRIVSCGCRTKPMDDPAVAVGLVMHYARIAMTRRLAIPPAVIALLAQRVEEGDPACGMVARWLEGSGLPGTVREKGGAAGRAR
ncbi:hypothetical protein ASD50_21225 [Mesorhizobium sp. Root552]|uniref:hypothetical protein n=1 Tax=Mesorhizobium sp. Root552 TaxID=1736555 RepID=UPI0007020D46|nr:hypothetical protein [Mesorhizobium sp. Root552]KQZ22430.1 hypothetical protein ASD50_21225 [Mesorhizobium sp. Root552]